MSRPQLNCRGSLLPKALRLFRRSLPFLCILAHDRRRSARAQLLGLGSKPAPPVVIPTLQPPIPGYVFPARQTLTFTVDWRVFTGGTAVFHLEQQGDQLKIAATADTAGAVNMLFPVVDRFQSAMDIRTGCSQGFSKQTQEGRRKVSTDLTLDYNAGKQTQIEKNLVKGTQKTSQQFDSRLRHRLALGNFLCGLAAIGRWPGLRVSAGRRHAHRHRHHEGRGERGDQDAGGDVQTIRVQPTAEEGVVKNRGNIWIWYTDDARHMPVQIRARLFWGTITFHLQSVEAK